MKQEINDGKIPTLALNKITVIACQRWDFLTELCYNTIFYLLFHWVLSSVVPVLSTGTKLIPVPAIFIPFLELELEQ